MPAQKLDEMIETVLYQKAPPIGSPTNYQSANQPLRKTLNGTDTPLPLITYQ